jgi:hypothetical protein
MGKHSLGKSEKPSGPLFLELRDGLPAGQMTFASDRAAAMYRRRVTRALGAAAGGLLGVVFLPAGAALADDYAVSPDPSSTEVITGIYGTGFFGAGNIPPALQGSTQGDQVFDFTDTTTGATGTFDGDESTEPDGLGDTNEEVIVTSVPGTDIDAPPVGSVFDTYTLDGGYDEYIYSAVPSPTGNLLSDTMVTPFGDYNIPMTFDAADVPVADATGVPLGDGDDFLPVADSQVITAINGAPPLTVAIQGDQLFDVDNAADTQVGSFGADETTTTDGLGTYTEAILVTSNSGATDDPPAGSIFNTINYGGIENIYSDITSATPGGADTISDTLVTPLGNYTIPGAFDAAAAETPVSVDLADGDDIAPDPSSAEIFTGVNGLPPVDVGIQGQQEFDLLSGNTVLGTFDADETKTVDLFGDTTQTLLVTQDESGASMPVGSVIETVTLGSGFENIYTDLASTTAGADVYSDTLVTPFGDFTIPVTLDLSAGLAADLFG